MRFERAAIPDVILVVPQVFADERGFFFESYRKDLFHAYGIMDEFVQESHSRSSRGTLRGLHYQVKPRSQAKLIRVLAGEIFDVAVDIRKVSPTFGRSVLTTLSPRDHAMLYIPVGFAHGFLAMEEATEVLYMTSEVYSPEHERGIRWDDPDLGIPWPRLDRDYIISEKDKGNPRFRAADTSLVIP